MVDVRSLDGIRLHAEIDGSGEPVTLFGHGLTNSCRELAPFTPFAPGTKVRFCFRGHGHSETPDVGHYGFTDYAADLRAVADAFGASRAVGTSLGAGALTRVVAEEPDRFDRLVFLLPAALDEPLKGHPLSQHTADLLETLPKDEAIRRALEDSGREDAYARAPGLRDYDLLLWQELDPVGVARAIRGIVGEIAVEDRSRLRAVEAPALVIAREGDALHPAWMAHAMVELMPKAELVMLASEEDLFASIPALVERVARFLA
jgi:pimeloyl-ACP methyl ester carboxylesterase